MTKKEAVRNPEKNIGQPHEKANSDQKIPTFRRSTAKDQPVGKCPIRFIPTEEEKDGIHGVGAIAIRDADTTIEAFESILKNLTATDDVELAQDIFNTGVIALPKDSGAQNLSIASQSLADASPKDAIESKFCMQEMALYTQGMNYLSKAERADSLDMREFFMKSAIKLLRLRNETIEAMTRYRRGGEQRVVVQHVTVSEGGQAIVGGVLQGGGSKNKEEQPHDSGMWSRI